MRSIVSAFFISACCCAKKNLQYTITSQFFSYALRHTSQIFYLSYNEVHILFLFQQLPMAAAKKAKKTVKKTAAKKTVKKAAKKTVKKATAKKTVKKVAKKTTKKK
jgi:hypothetical protein